MTEQHTPHEPTFEVAEAAVRQSSIARWYFAAAAIAGLVHLAAVAQDKLFTISNLVGAVGLGALCCGISLMRREAIGREQTARVAIRETEGTEAELRDRGFLDALTGAPNVSLLNDRVEQALRRQSRTQAPIALLIVDLDDFKSVNAQLGHALADQVLVDIVTRLRTSARPIDTVARIGSDTFAVLSEGTDVHGAAALADRLIAQIALPLDVSGLFIRVQAGVGIVVEAPGASAAADLIKRAELAMYAAKQRGKGCQAFFSKEMQDQATRAGEIRENLREALANKELKVEYQPYVELASGRVVGAEALVRWERPGDGLISPGEFLPVAEQSSLICDIDSYVLAEAVSQVADWTSRFPHLNFRMSVNLSVRKLQDRSLLDEVKEVLASSNVSGESLMIEITETALMTDMATIRDHLTALQRLGIRIALDDFGTGFSSLSHIHQFPIDVLKIERTFVSEMTKSNNAAVLVDLVAALGRKLSLVTVAEGVETFEQLEQVRALGCHLAQGFLFAKPQPPADCETLFSQSKLDLSGATWATDPVPAVASFPRRILSEASN